jgi:hypothetical protein
MASKGKTKPQFVREASKSELLALTLISSSSALLGGGLLVVLLLLEYPNFNFDISLALWLLFPISFGLIAVSRNRILKRTFNWLSYDGCLYSPYFWKRIFPLLEFVFSFYFFLSAFRDVRYLLVALSFIFLSIPFYFIFESSLSMRGWVQSLFEGLFSSFNNYFKLQYYWRSISKTIEGLMEIGNIQLSSNELIFEFNRKLLETNEDISNDLRSIEAWMLNERRTVLDVIERIFPSIEIRRCTKISFFEKISAYLQNPNEIQAGLIKFVLSLIFVFILSLIVLAFRPELFKDIANSLFTDISS